MHYGMSFVRLVKRSTFGHVAPPTLWCDPIGATVGKQVAKCPRPRLRSALLCAAACAEEEGVRYAGAGGYSLPVGLERLAAEEERHGRICLAPQAPTARERVQIHDALAMHRQPGMDYVVDQERLTQRGGLQPTERSINEDGHVRGELRKGAQIDERHPAPSGVGAMTSLVLSLPRPAWRRNFDGAPGLPVASSALSLDHARRRVGKAYATAWANLKLVAHGFENANLTPGRNGRRHGCHG